MVWWNMKVHGGVSVWARVQARGINYSSKTGGDIMFKIIWIKMYLYDEKLLVITMNLCDVEDTKKWDIASTKEGQLPRWSEFTTWGMIWHIATKASDEMFGHSHPSFKQKVSKYGTVCMQYFSVVKILFIVKFLSWHARFAYPLGVIVGVMPAGFSVSAGHPCLIIKGCSQHPLCTYSHSPAALPSTIPQKASL